MRWRAVVVLALGAVLACTHPPARSESVESCSERCQRAALGAYFEEHVPSDDECVPSEEDPDSIWECLWGARAERAKEVRDQCEALCPSP